MTLTIPGARAFDSRRIAIVGLGKSGRACISVLSRLTRAALSAWDECEEAVENLSQMHQLRLDHAQSQDDPQALASSVLAWKPDLIVPAPAISEISPLFMHVREAGIEIVSEIELAWRLRACTPDGQSAPWLCVTGTNGKTTTVSMTAAILREAGLGEEAIGNIGRPAIEEVTRTGEGAPRAFALELSSFQLATTSTMAPRASICLNIDDDHLEWHGSREAYWRAKARVYDNTEGFCFFPEAEADVDAMVREADVAEGTRACALTLGAPSVGSIGLVEGVVVDRATTANRHTHGLPLFEIADITHLAPTGSDLPLHILKDAMAAAALARTLDISPEVISHALRTFTPGHHRIELVASVEGVRFVDDSKATNAHAARASLLAQEVGSVVWIVGGLAKGARFVDLVNEVKDRLKAVVVIGKDQAPWHEALDGLKIPITWTDPESSAPMHEAVHAAYSYASAGDTVLLAPASASFDQFASYAARGEAFAEAARGSNND